MYVGRVSVEKNLDRLVSLFRKRPGVRLKVAGDSPFRKRMQAELGNACFEGFLTGQALSEAYASADFFVFPSTNDTFGNVVLEAMASGLPVIVTDRMGPRELVLEGETGFIARTPVEFSERVDWLASRPQERAVMAAKARQAALGRSWQAVFHGLFRDYRKLVSRCRPMRRSAPASQNWIGASGLS